MTHTFLYSIYRSTADDNFTILFDNFRFLLAYSYVSNFPRVAYLKFKASVERQFSRHHILLIGVYLTVTVFITNCL